MNIVKNFESNGRTYTAFNFDRSDVKDFQLSLLLANDAGTTGQIQPDLKLMLSVDSKESCLDSFYLHGAPATKLFEKLNEFVRMMMQVGYDERIGEVRIIPSRTVEAEQVAFVTAAIVERMAA